MTQRKANPLKGGSFEEFLVEEGIRDGVTAVAKKRVLTWQRTHGLSALQKDSRRVVKPR